MSHRGIQPYPQMPIALSPSSTYIRHWAVFTRLRQHAYGKSGAASLRRRLIGRLLITISYRGLPVKSVLNL